MVATMRGKTLMVVSCREVSWRSSVQYSSSDCSDREFNEFSFHKGSSIVDFHFVLC